MNKKNMILACLGVILLGLAGLYVAVKIIKWPLMPAGDPAGEPIEDVPHVEIKPEPNEENIV